MGFIKLKAAQDSSRGVRYSNPVLGTVAHVKLAGCLWDVFPYQFPPISHRREFASYHAAEQYAYALAYEMHHLGLCNTKV